MTTTLARLLACVAALHTMAGCYGVTFDNPRFANDADGHDLPQIACEDGLHDDGTGVCVDIDTCSDGFHSGGGDARVCVALNTCSDAFHVADDGSCQPGPPVVCGDGLQVPSEECDDGNLVDNDGCDSNCSTTACGNGIPAGSEACDDGNRVDGDGCDSNCRPTGCGNEVVAIAEECDDGNDLDADGCDTNCRPTGCGNGHVTDDEKCDDGNAADNDGCDTNCTRTACGNGVIAGDEECDDLNLTDGDGCDSNCRTTGCGNAQRVAPEECDDGNDIDDDGCDHDCSVSRCGNAVVAGAEECDDGNGDNDDWCTNACSLPICGDHIVQAGEACDDGNVVDGDGCDSTCRLTGCSSGAVTAGEECDDANEVEGDGCDSNCRVSACGNGITAGEEECDDGALFDDDGCDSNCTATRCGNGVVTRLEECDDGDAVTGDGCDVNCTFSRCGNGAVAAGEECDDGNEVNGDRCDENCTVSRCGNGLTGGSEACDDGNTLSGDGCRADCGKVERCGDGLVDTGEACDDGNPNPFDGCDACRLQGWKRLLVVSGAVEGRLAVDTGIDNPLALARGPDGSIFIAGLTQIFRLDLDGSITRIAGSLESSFSGEGGLAAEATLNSPSGIAIDTLGRVWIADSENHRVRRIDRDGRIRTVAGTGVPGFGGDGGAAISAQLRSPGGLAVESSGAVLVADTGNHTVRRIDTDGIIRSICGQGRAGVSGDGGLAVNAFLNFPRDVLIDKTGRVVIADQGNNCVRRIDLDGRVTSIVTGTTPKQLAVDDNGGIIVVNTGENRVDRFTPNPVTGNFFVERIAGTGVHGFTGDGGPGSEAKLGQPFGVVIDSVGRILIADFASVRIRSVGADGIINTIAGLGSRHPAGDDSPALSCPSAPGEDTIAIDSSGTLFIASVAGTAGRVRQLTAEGVMTIAGRGPRFSTTETGTTASTKSFSPFDIAIDGIGRIIIADIDNQLVRRFERNGAMTTIAGNPAAQGGSAIIGAPATSVSILPFGVGIDLEERTLILNRATSSEFGILRIESDGLISNPFPTGLLPGGANGIAVDSNGGILVASHDFHAVFRGTTSVMAGRADRQQSGFSGDGGPATLARLSAPTDVAVDSFDRVLIADSGNHRIRRVNAGVITTVAGSGANGHEGDGGPALEAAVTPFSVDVDPDGRIFIAGGDRIRRVDIDGIITSVAGTVHPPGPGPGERARVYPSRALVMLDDHTALATAENGRIERIDVLTGDVEVVFGYPDAHPSRYAEAVFAPLLRSPGGAALDVRGHRLFVTEAAAATLRIVDLDPDGDGLRDASLTWTNHEVTTTLVAPAGVVYDGANDTLIVADEGDHCVRRVDTTGVVLGTLFGICGTAGSTLTTLRAPAHVVVSPTTGALYIADTGNQRVLRVDAEGASLVVGTGEGSSLGDGAPARGLPVDEPRQLAVDAFGNLFIASRSTVREVANVDGDGDADGDDRVISVYGAGSRSSFPERDSFCIRALALDSGGALHAADSCQGFMVRVTPVTTP